MNAENLENLTAVASRLNTIGLNDVVYVGGAIIGLLLTDEAAPSIRPTLDVDVVTPVATRSAYNAIEAKLRAAGFRQSMDEEAPICRWILDGIPVDLMPLDEAILGFSNRWYAQLIEHAVHVGLPDGTPIRAASAPFMIATKLEAFYGRGAGDYRVSHDLEDIIILLDGRAGLHTEIRQAPKEVRIYIAETFRNLLNTPEFVDSIPGYLDPDDASQARAPLIRQRMEQIRDIEPN